MNSITKFSLFLTMLFRNTAIYAILLAILLVYIFSRKIYNKICLFIIGILVAAIICATGLILEGIQRGVFDPETSLIEIYQKLSHTPKESKLPERKNLGNAMLIFFRFGCSDCEAVYQDLSLALQNKPDIYWVSTMSNQGQDLLSKYPISETPTLIYIYPDAERFAIFELHTKDQNNNIVLNQDLLNQAIMLQEKGRKSA